MAKAAKQHKGVAAVQTGGGAVGASTGADHTAAASPRKRRVATAETRRADILAAALDEFTARGFQAARPGDRGVLLWRGGRTRAGDRAPAARARVRAR